MKKKMGRPTDNPKNVRINVRLDAECERIVTKYVKKYEVSQAEAIRRGIKMLSQDVGE